MTSVPSLCVGRERRFDVCGDRANRLVIAFTTDDLQSGFQRRSFDRNR
jgi:hypothetical protein